MAITVGAATAKPEAATNTGTASPATITVPAPTGLAAGDMWCILICDWMGNNGGTDMFAANLPTGFTSQATTWHDGTSGNCGIHLLYKANCTGAEGAATITGTSTLGTIEYVTASWLMSGCATSTAFIDIADGSSSAETTTPIASTVISTAASHTPTADNEVVFVVGATATVGCTSVGGVGYTTPTGFTLLTVAQHDALASGCRTSLGIFYQIQTTATAVPITSTTASFPGNSSTTGAKVGLIFSVFAASAGASDTFPAYHPINMPATNAIYKL